MNQITNFDNDHAAIMEVVSRETETFVTRDIAGWSACWVQDERARDVCVSSSIGATILNGWKQLNAYMQNFFETGSVCNISDFQRSNISITVSGNIAHVVFDEQSTHLDGRIENSFETRVLERSNGIWRILYASFVLRGHQQMDRNRVAVDSVGEILYAPAEAVGRLKSNLGLQVSGNKLRALKPKWDKVLQAGIKWAGEQHGYFQHYRYMTENGRGFSLPIVLGETDDGGVAVCFLFVRDGMTFVESSDDQDLHNRISVAGNIFGLSRGQMQLASRIVSGEGLTAASSSLGISVNTAKTHLSRIYEKTGVSSQTALVRTLLSVGWHQ